jgi:hypothetical protein
LRDGQAPYLSLSRQIREKLIGKQNGLLQKALKVYWIQYAMSRRFTFSQQTAALATARLRNPSTVIASQQDISAKVLNRQLKGALKILYEEQLKELLQRLENEYKVKTRKSWVLCFCTNLILCLIVAQLQIAIDGLVMYNISTKGEDPVLAIEGGSKCCEQLEELPVKYSWTMFFGLYKSYNPIKNGLPPDDESGQNGGEAELINTFAQMISDNGKALPAADVQSS